MLKRKLDKAVWEKLSDEMKPLYKEKDGAYTLDLEAASSEDDDSGELRRAHDRLKEDLKAAKKALKDKEALEEDGEVLDAKKKGDIEKLEKSWQGKVDAVTKEKDATILKQSEFIKTTLLDSAAKDVASIATSPTILMPHVKSRLTVDLDGDVPTIRVLGKDGKPSAASLDELKKEFVANKEFSTIIVASKASGGAAKANDGKTRSDALTTQGDQPKLLSQVKPLDLVAHLKAKKEAGEQQE